MSLRDRIEAFAADKVLQPWPIHESGFMDTKDIPFDLATRGACEKNYCGQYGRTWACPPGCGTFEELKAHFMDYSNAFVYTTVHELEDSYDIEGMSEGRKKHAELDDAFAAFLKDEPAPHELCDAGGCSICKKCTYPDAPCRFPDKMRRSMESTGINVMSLSKILDIHYINGVNTVTYFSMIYF